MPATYEDLDARQLESLIEDRTGLRLPGTSKEVLLKKLRELDKPLTRQGGIYTPPPKAEVPVLKKVSDTQKRITDIRAAARGSKPAIENALEDLYAHIENQEMLISALSSQNVALEERVAALEKQLAGEAQEAA